jgi:hypothetical protein
VRIQRADDPAPITEDDLAIGDERCRRSQLGLNVRCPQLAARLELERVDDAIG